MSVFQRPAPKIQPRIDHTKRRLGISPPQVKDSRPAQLPAAPFAPPTDSDIQVAEKYLGKPQSDETEEEIVQRLVRVHTCAEALAGDQCRSRKCKERIPRANADRLVFDGTHKWVVFTRDDRPYVSSNAIVALETKVEQKPEQKVVRVHACFDQTRESKPKRCYCAIHYSEAEARSVVDSGRAYWLLVKDDERIYARRDAIVLTVEEVKEREKRILRRAPVEKFRIAQTEAVSLGQIPDVRLTDDQIWAGFKDPEKFCDEFPQLRLQVMELRKLRNWPGSKLSKRLMQGCKYYWERLLRSEHLSVGQGKFMKNAPKGRGLLHQIQIPLEESPDPESSQEDKLIHNLDHAGSVEGRPSLHTYHVL